MVFLAPTVRVGTERLPLRGETAMSFQETLHQHLTAIQNRDLDRLIETLPDDELVLIMSDGKVVRSVGEFVEAHRGWFAMPTWEIRFKAIHTFETTDVGIAVFELDYSDLNPDHSRFHEQSVLTLVFAQRNGRWVMTHDQNTPMRGAMTEH